MDPLFSNFTIEFNYTESIYYSPTNNTLYELPKFDDNALIVVIAYSLLFIIAAIGNLTVFITLVRGRHRKSRISLMITHLAAADLFVTFIMIPLEIGWRLTTQWVAGNIACKLFLFLRAFGLYLSSNVLVCVSVDRYFAILHPLRVSDARRRGKMMLTMAWIFSLICALPQSVVFHVSQHPQHPDFWQCVTFGFFGSRTQEIAYNLFCVMAMYFVPLLVIVIAYTCILLEISKKTKETRADQWRTGHEERTRGRMRLRRSDMSNIERARARTLRMTVTIVLAFIWCWTPYVVMTLWYMFDRESAEKVDPRLQDALFIMAVSNSCMNPLVYGSYALNFRRECTTCFCYLFSSHQQLDRRSTGSGITRSTAVTGYGGTLGSRNHLTVPRKNVMRPASAEHLVIRGRMIETAPLNPEEFHSDPGTNTGIYLVTS
ncbi:adipokinetic hormone/corazonin-related peptide receptor variant I-like isoform X2 [Rhodnius prolixus]|uniref:Adipokinetic hormone/corazonin-related peptide receptor variant C n=1 Tax=Rhodnius prolixus TaxID=13249 RepID=A0A0K0NTY8_RHOPR|nr:adipokinetic hormone/corazonin-related peptide receptor variant C [Rhodnius prolixus]